MFIRFYEYNYYRPDGKRKKVLPDDLGKPFLINNTKWRIGKVTMDFGVFGDVISKFTAVASAV